MGCVDSWLILQAPILTNSAGSQRFYPTPSPDLPDETETNNRSMTPSLSPRLAIENSPSPAHLHASQMSNSAFINSQTFCSPRSLRSRVGAGERDQLVIGVVEEDLDLGRGARSRTSGGQEGEGENFPVHESVAKGRKQNGGKGSGRPVRGAA